MFKLSNKKKAHILDVVRESSWEAYSFIFKNHDESLTASLKRTLLSFVVRCGQEILADRLHTMSDRLKMRHDLLYPEQLKPVFDFVNSLIKEDVSDNLTVLLHGEPGTGKSFVSVLVAAVIRGHGLDYTTHDMANDMSSKVDVHVSSREEHHHSILIGNNDAICVNSLDEIDRYVTDERSIARLIRLLDRPKQSFKSSVTIVTTNNLSKIPPVLLRPGRVDLIIELKGFNKREAELYLAKNGIGPETPLPPPSDSGYWIPGELYAFVKDRLSAARKVKR